MFWTVADGTGVPERITFSDGTLILTPPEAITPDTMIHSTTNTTRSINYSLWAISISAGWTRSDARIF